MRLSHWMALIAVFVAVGFLSVSQRNAIYGQGYAVGRRLHKLHAEQSDVSRLRAQVTGLEAPTRLAQLADERRLKLVAWSTLSPDRPSAWPDRPAAVAGAAEGDVVAGAGAVQPDRRVALLNEQGSDTAD